jgi:tetratricopeptide (TPR) repeat protein
VRQRALASSAPRRPAGASATAQTVAADLRVRRRAGGIVRTSDWDVRRYRSSAIWPSRVVFTLILLAMPLSGGSWQAYADEDRLSPERRREILREALNAFDDGVAIAHEEPSRAEQLFRQAAGAFEALAADGVRSPALEYNLGNTYFRLGDLGRAVLHYRRARRLDPGHAKLAENLKYARNRVEPTIDLGGEQRLLRRLLFWHYNTSVRLRFWLTLMTSVAGWLGLAVWLRRRWQALAVLGVLALVLGLANAVSVAWQLHDESRHPPSVVVQGEQILRLGRGEGYDPAMKQALGPGIELRVLQQRGDWVEVRLANGQTGWLPAQAVERV